MIRLRSPSVESKHFLVTPTPIFVTSANPVFELIPTKSVAHEKDWTKQNFGYQQHLFRITSHIATLTLRTMIRTLSGETGE